LAGNVDEWTFDWFADYPASATDDYACTTPSSGRVVRGGFFLGGEVSMYAARRIYGVPHSHLGILGFRCARTIQ
jgi:formylglycine-generating enzyme required for sulfatase activity